MGSEEPIKAKNRLVVQEGGGLEATLLLKQGVDQSQLPLFLFKKQIQTNFDSCHPTCDLLGLFCVWIEVTS